MKNLDTLLVLQPFHMSLLYASNRKRSALASHAASFGDQDQIISAKLAHQVCMSWEEFRQNRHSQLPLSHDGLHLVRHFLEKLLRLKKQKKLQLLEHPAAFQISSWHSRTTNTFPQKMVRSSGPTSFDLCSFCKARHSCNIVTML